MSKPHKHADVIKAWADGKAIQWAYIPGPTSEDPLAQRGPDWQAAAEPPSFDESYLWRIRPEPLKWRAEREAFAHGERVQFRSVVMGSEWQDLAPGYAVAWGLPFGEFRIPHKWQNEIDAWERGEDVEVRDDNGIEGPLCSLAGMVGKRWKKIDRLTTPRPAWATTMGREYRIKPKTETFKLRVALMQATSSSAPFTSTAVTYSEATTVERQAAFVRWLCGWQEVEVETSPRLEQGSWKAQHGQESDGGVAAVKQALEDCAKFGVGALQVGVDLGKPGGDASAFLFRRVHVNK